MAGLATLEEHADREPPTVAIQATGLWEAVDALAKLQEGGLGIDLSVGVNTLLNYKSNAVNIIIMSA